MYSTFVIGDALTWASRVDIDEGFLEKIASVGSIFGAVRFIWSFMLDKFSYKRIMCIFLVLQTTISFSLPFIIEHMETNSKLQHVLYSIAIPLTYNLEGALFVMTPTVFAKLYGPQGGLRVYSVGFCFIACASLMNILLNTLLFKAIGYQGLSFINAALTLVALFLLLFIFKEEKVVIKSDKVLTCEYIE
jgi:MFS family permease